MGDKLLILGLGSIGQRHARNALAMGCEVIGYDMRKLFDVPPQIDWVESIRQGLALHPLGVIVATPPETHYKLALSMIESGIPCLIEKPLATIWADALGIVTWAENHKVPLAIGYQLRFHPSLRRLKAQADAGEFGTMRGASAYFSSQKWCSGTYPADFLLECSHELDMLRWFFGDPKYVETMGEKNGEYAAGVIHFQQGEAGFCFDSVHPGYTRRMALIGGKGSAQWNFDQAENDQAYVDELAEFLRICRGEQAAPSCTGRDGWWAVRIVEAIRKSGETGRWETI